MTPIDSIPNDSVIPPRRGFLFVVISSALAAALVAWLAGETPYVRVAPAKVPMVTMGTPHLGTTAETVHAAVKINAARSNAAFGALLGLALGTVGGWSRRARAGALTAALAGAVMGLLTGGLTAYAGVPLYHRYHESFSSDLFPSLLFHGAVWGAIGGSAALSLALGSKMPRIPLVVAGIVGALVGTVAFEFLGAVAFANDETGEPVSASAVTRLLAPILVALFVAVGSWASQTLSRKRLA